MIPAADAAFDMSPRCGGCGAELDVDVRDSGGNWFTVKRGVNPGYELDVCPATEDDHVPDS